jgi:hypothetical protein
LTTPRNGLARNSQLRLNYRWQVVIRFKVLILNNSGTCKTPVIINKKPSTNNARHNVLLDNINRNVAGVIKCFGVCRFINRFYDGSRLVCIARKLLV